MTQEQMENAMNFIIEQQAKFAVDMELMKEAHEQRMKEIQAVQATHQELIEQLTTASLQTFEVIAQLGKAQKQTEERLNILIGVVENHISNHNGKH